jgi:hypothetical protein
MRRSWLNCFACCAAVVSLAGPGAPLKGEQSGEAAKPAAGSTGADSQNSSATASTPEGTSIGTAKLPSPACGSPDELKRYVTHVTAMLEAGLGKVPNRAKAKEQFDHAQSLCASDPRLYYGQALVLQGINRAEATNLLAAALEKGAYAYPPAWRLLIDLELRKPLEKRIVTGLPRFAERLAAANGTWPDTGAKVEFAEFLGLVVGFWQYASSDAAKFAAEITATDREIIKLLPETQRQAYELGKTKAKGTFDELTQQSTEQSEQQKLAAQDQKSEIERKLATGKQEFDDKEQKLVRTKEEYDRKWEQMKNDYQRERTAMEAEFKGIADTANRISAEISKAANEVAVLQGTLDNYRRIAAQQKKPLDASLLSNYENMISRKGTARALFEVQLAETQRKGYALQMKAQSKLQEMAKAEADYQRATGQLVKESGLIAGARKSLDAQSEKQLKRKARAVAGTASAELRKFSTYAPLNVETEKERILRSYAN